MPVGVGFVGTEGCWWGHFVGSKDRFLLSLAAVVEGLVLVLGYDSCRLFLNL